MYPKKLLFDNPWEDFFRFYPQVSFDIPRMWERIQLNKYQDFSSQIETDGYPSYYLQNFHYESNGYLSNLSANLYDLQVELLLLAQLMKMRRRFISPLKRGLRSFESVIPREIRILDVACGTARTLRMIRATLPQASLHGTVLSPLIYVRQISTFSNSRRIATTSTS